MSIYCVYLTIYKGNKLPPFYIGYSTIKKVLNGYKGTVSSKLYKDIYKQELSDNPHLFKTFIISKLNTREEALKKESYFQKHFSAHTNSMYFNMAISNVKFQCTDHSFKQTESYRQKVSENNRKRWSDPEYKERLVKTLRKTKGTKEWREEQKKRSQEMANDPLYIEKLSQGVKRSWDKKGEKERRSKILQESYKNNPEFAEKKRAKKWWTDGTISKHSEICPPGFRRGRITSWQGKR